MAEHIEEKAHALLSPSGAARWTRCPGSVVLEQGLEDRVSVYADWGTVCHEVADLILTAVVNDELRGWRPGDAEAYVGRVFTVGEKEYTFDIEMADCVNDYVAHVESFWSPGCVLLPETQVPLEQITGEAGATGTSDCIIIRDGEITVIDLKTGKGVEVDAEENEQGLMYAAGAAHEYDLLYGPFDRVRIVIIQPRLNSVSEWAIDWAEFEERVGRLEEAAKTCHEALILGAVRATDSEIGDAGLLFPGLKQCQWCKAKATCPALVGEVVAHLGATVADVDDFPDLSLPKQAAAAATLPDDLDHEKLAEAWRALPLIEKWIEAVRSRTRARLHDGQPVGNLTLYEGKRGSRFWLNEAEAEALMKKRRVKADEMYAKKLISPTAAEKLLKGKPIWADLAGFIDQGEGKPVVGVEGDTKRTPWQPCPPDDFPDLDAEDNFDPSAYEEMKDRQARRGTIFEVEEDDLFA